MSKVQCVTSKVGDYKVSARSKRNRNQSWMPSIKQLLTSVTWEAKPSHVQHSTKLNSKSNCEKHDLRHNRNLNHLDLFLHGFCLHLCCLKTAIILHGNQLSNTMPIISHMQQYVIKQLKSVKWWVFTIHDINSCEPWAKWLFSIERWWTV